MPLGPLLLFGNDQASNPGASVVTLYCANPIATGSNAGTLQTSVPPASTSTTGWTVGTTASGNYSRQSYNNEVPAAGFSTTAQPSNSPLNSAQDTWRYGPISGQFSLGTWYSSLSVIGVTSGGDQDGRVRMRLWRSHSSTAVTDVSDSDNFNRANSSNRGANWTSVSGFNSQILSNQAAANASGDAALEYRNTITPGAAQSAQITLGSVIESTAGFGVGPAIRIQTGADTGYVMAINTVAGERFRVYRRITGTNTFIFGYTGAAPVAGDQVKLQVNSAFDLELYVNGVLRASFTDTDANKIATGRVGDYGLITAVVATWDDWSGGAVGGSGVDEITSIPGTMVGTTVTNLSTTVAQSSAGSWRIPAFPVSNEYLFMQAAWEITGAGGAADRDVLVRYGSMGATDGSGLVTAPFAASGAVAVLGGGSYFLRRRRLDALTGLEDK